MIYDLHDFFTLENGGLSGMSNDLHIVTDLGADAFKSAETMILLEAPWSSPESQSQPGDPQSVSTVLQLLTTGKSSTYLHYIHTASESRLPVLFQRYSSSGTSAPDTTA